MPDMYRPSVATIRSTVSRRSLLAGTGAGVGTALLAPVLPAIAGKESVLRPIRLYAIGDVHISSGSPVTMQDMRGCIAELTKVGPGADALVVNGDLTEHGYPEEYRLLDLTRRTSPTPRRVLYAIGNHEYHSGGTATADQMRQRFLDFTRLRQVYYATQVGGYPIVFIGQEDIAPGETNTNTVRAVLSDAQLTWLADTLAKVSRPDRPTLMFSHQPPDQIVQWARLQAIMRATPNLVFFFGHWHSDLHNLTQGPEPRLLGKVYGYWQIHTASTSYLYQNVRQPNGSTKAVLQGDWKQGLLIDVSPTQVRVRGRDFWLHEWVPGFDATIPIGTAQS